jgi:hypothetical protein
MDLPDEPEGALGTLGELFGLSAFEQRVLLLCAGVELDGRVATLCGAANGDPARAYATFGLALAALPGPEWVALAPDAPLRRWRLVEIGPGDSLVGSRLRIDERVLHALAGVPAADERLSCLLEVLQTPNRLSAAQVALIERAAAAWAAAEGTPAIQLLGESRDDLRMIAAGLCARLGMQALALPAHLVPTAPADLATLTALIGREAVLGGTALVLEGDSHDAPDVAREHALARLAGDVIGLVLLLGRHRAPLGRASLSYELPPLGLAERAALWRGGLGPATTVARVEQLAAQFGLGVQAIAEICAEALAEPADGGLGERIWTLCRRRARPQLDSLARRIEPAAGWGDLVLPATAHADLLAIVAHMRGRATVYERWGFGRGGRGLGITALFAGPSGTGKTLAAEVIAAELGLDLYHIDLSQVVSKYIGETEKNLGRIFDAAEAGGAVLLFDEADALFGKRSEVKDSHDRHANIEVSYLLQRMEQYSGLALLTSNMPGALDSAFMRRLRFVVSFPFPGPSERTKIWARAIPAAAPTEGLDMAALARMNVAGGSIRNIALHGAFLAAGEGAPLRMGHLLQAAQGEYARLERALTAAEIGGWA